LSKSRNITEYNFQPDLEYWMLLKCSVDSITTTILVLIMLFSKLGDMSKKRLPSQSELEQKYSSLLHNLEIQKVINWSLPNCADGFDEEKSLEFMEEESQAFFDAAMKILDLPTKSE
jgi:hypothetical protein